MPRGSGLRRHGGRRALRGSVGCRHHPPGPHGGPVLNHLYQAAIDDTNIPQIITELVYLRIGQASLISAPGELNPELFIGCYDGSCSGSQELLDPNNEYPPDLSQAPEGPYLRDLVAVDGSTYQWLLGLTQDMLGYIMPDYNFKLAPVPYLEEAPGEHYEETNSLGPRARTELIDPLEELITYDHE